MPRKKATTGNAATTQAASVVSAPSALDTNVARKQFRLEDLHKPAMDHLGARDWQAMFGIANLPIDQFSEQERSEAAVWLARVYWVAATRAGERPVAYFNETERAELHRRLQVSADMVPDFFRYKEFEAYLDSFGYSTNKSVPLYYYLVGVCEQTLDLRWIVRLRHTVRRLVNAYDSEEQDRDSEHALPAKSGMFDSLNAVYARAGQAEGLSEADSFLLTALRAELGMLTVEPWDVPDVAALLRTLHSPSSDEIATYLAEHQGQALRGLSPVALAFIWELAETSYSGFPHLLGHYPEDLGCALGTGLRRLVESLVCPEEQVDALLSESLQLLMTDREAMPPWIGDSILVKTEEGVCEIYLDGIGFYVPKEVPELLLHLYESAPERHGRVAELEALYRIYNAATNCAPLEDEDDAGTDIPGLNWLCSQSLPFQFAAAENIQGMAGRARLVLDGIRRAAVEGLQPPCEYFLGELAGEEMNREDVASILEVIDRIIPARNKMSEKVERLWRQVAPSLFKEMSLVDGEIRKDVLRYARYCEDDLLAGGRAFTLGYLEQTVGTPERALICYLHELDNANELNETAVKNAKLLWAKTNNLKLVSSLVQMLTDAVSMNARENSVRELLADARVRQDVLNQEDQFERTAVNRWPSITAPARKLLGVLTNIQRYNGFQELADYAGMQVEWVERHYKKLLDTGMLFRTNGNYRINPYIQPLLELESQHTVVSRIVRSQGTSAVKQVFNSQREFTIYQVMVQLCPNHMVFPNCSLQSVMGFDRMKELVDDDDFGYYLRASVDIVVVSSTTYLPMLAIEVDSVWHDTERQRKNDGKKDRLFAAAGIPFMRLRPVGTPSENVIRGQVAEHLDELVRTLRDDLPGYAQVRGLLEDLSGLQVAVVEQ